MYADKQYPALERTPGKQFVSLGEQNCESATQGGPLVTLWPLPSHVQRTVSPTEMLTVSGSNVKSHPAPPSHRQSRRQAMGTPFTAGRPF